MNWVSISDMCHICHISHISHPKLDIMLALSNLNYQIKDNYSTTITTTIVEILQIKRLLLDEWMVIF